MQRGLWKPFINMTETKDCNAQDTQIGHLKLIFWRRSWGVSLVRDPYCEHGVGLWCDVDVLCAAEEGAWERLKLDLRCNLLRVQFWTSVQRKRF